MYAKTDNLAFFAAADNPLSGILQNLSTNSTRFGTSYAFFTYTPGQIRVANDYNIYGARSVALRGNEILEMH